MSVKLKAAFADETHLAEGQWLEWMFRVGTQRPAVTRAEGQHLVLLQTQYYYYYYLSELNIVIIIINVAILSV
jgi:hypothetical protein